MAQPKALHVCIVGGGIGGLAAAIAIRRAGAQVTVLEAASELGEIGAGIQMSGNVSRFLIRTGVDQIIGDNLVAHQEARNWTTVEEDDSDTQDPLGTGRLVGRLLSRDIVRDQGFPWWVVRRDHLHAGLAEGARRHGAELIIDARVQTLKATEHGVEVTTVKGRRFRFDLVVGADGINSAVRHTIFPDLKPLAVSKMAAYRCVLPYQYVYEKVPEARTVLGNNMDAWSGPGGYVLLYPLSAGRELNIVTAKVQDHHVSKLEDVDIQEFRDQYRDFPPFIQKIIGLVPEVKRWPLLVVPPTNTWSNEHKNIVLMGDAIHSMQNHMAQGAATSMEDGMFLGRVISEHLRQPDLLSLNTAIRLYERKRIPRAWHKQQSALVQGEMWSIPSASTAHSHLPETKRSRDRSQLHAEIAAFDRNPTHPHRELAPTYRSSMLFMSPWTVPAILCYDAEADADWAVCEYLMGRAPGWDRAETLKAPGTKVENETIRGNSDSGVGGIDERSDNGWDPERLVSARLLQKWWSAVWDNGVERWEASKTAAEAKAKTSSDGKIKSNL